MGDNGHTEIVRLLLQQPNIDLNKIDNWNTTALDIATENNHTDVIQLLTNAASHLQSTSSTFQGETKTQNGNNNKKEKKKRKKTKEKVQATADDSERLWNACFGGRLDEVQSLLDLDGIDINNQHGTTPLFAASQEGNIDIVKVLLKADGNVNQHSNKNQTPLNIASCNGHTEIVRLLLQQPNIDLNKEDDWNDSPLDCATENNHTDVIQLLTNAGAK